MKNFTFLSIFLLGSFAFGQSIANYNIEFISVWETPAGDPVNGISTKPLPSGAHWSSLAIATHKTANTIFMLGAPASAGIESIAETGSTSAFQSEVTANPDADKFVIGSGLGSAQGSIAKNIQVNETYPFVSLATMIAPSPDWFVAVNSENLRSGNNTINNGWKATFTIDVFPYDAGTEDGDDYSLSNPATNPLGVITSLSNLPPFDGVNSNGSHRIGTVTFNYSDSTLSTDTIDPLENIKVYPNPSKGEIHISNTQNINLKNVEIYNVLGSLIKEIPLGKTANKTTLNLSYLNRGVYILKLNTIGIDTKILKFIVE